MLATLWGWKVCIRVVLCHAAAVISSGCSLPVGTSAPYTQQVMRQGQQVLMHASTAPIVRVTLSHAAEISSGEAWLQAHQQQATHEVEY